MSMFLSYKPPKELRALFIIHYAPLLLIILIGPLTHILRVCYNVSLWEIPTPIVPTMAAGTLIFIGGTVFYLKWEMFWHKTYKGQLVTTGFFRYIRHPHYTSLLIIAIGLALFFYSLAAVFFAIISIPIMIWSIIDEEKHLLRQYGEEYREYMYKVKWRMIPGVF